MLKHHEEVNAVTCEFHVIANDKLNSGGYMWQESLNSVE